MSIIKLEEFGLNLSGRARGIQAFNIIMSKHSAPFEVDFVKIFSIGSNFADEVIAKLAKKNGDCIVVYNSARVVNGCLCEVAKDKKFELIFK